MEPRLLQTYQCKIQPRLVQLFPARFLRVPVFPDSFRVKDVCGIWFPVASSGRLCLCCHLYLGSSPQHYGNYTVDI